MLVFEIRRDGSIFSPKGPPPPHFRGGGSLNGEKFKLLLEGWCLQQSCRVGRGDNKYAKILPEGPATTKSRGAKV
jgi:hypothetical protein